jgi:hypothetical protein
MLVFLKRNTQKEIPKKKHLEETPKKSIKKEV